MKKIFLAILGVVGGMSLQSCLHDDKEFFDDSAANRIESTVENTKKILESADNGWELQYYTGSQYSGGGYTLLLNFKNGKVTVGGDPALATSTERISSSYTVDRSMGPVITFNTYNSILHKLGTPNINNIEGEQADWEFVVTKLTEDSVFVKGKKWGNEMVFTRLPQTVDWKEHLDSIGDIASKLKDNYAAGAADDASKVIEINKSTRRIVYRNAMGQVEEHPFVIIPTGVKSLGDVTIGGATTDELNVTKTGNIQVKDNEQIELAPYIAPIDTWVGSWSLSAMAGSCDMTIKKYEAKADSLTATFKADGLEYTLGLNYDEQTGYLHLDSQVLPDPSNKYAAIWFMSADLTKGMLLGMKGVNLIWHCVSKEASFEGENVVDIDGTTYTVDSFIGVAIDSSGRPIQEDKKYVFTTEWYYLSSLSRN